jgi:ABC-type multidrug transport system fused ATPase/permease subunit
MKKNFHEFLDSVGASLGFSFKIVPRETLTLILIMLVIAAVPYGSSYLLGELVNNAIGVASKSVAVSSIFFTLFGYAIISLLPSIIGNYRIFIEQSWRFKFHTYMEIFSLRKRIDVDIAQYEDPKFQDLQQRALRHDFWPILSLAGYQFDALISVASLILGSIVAANLSLNIFLIILIATVPQLYVEWKYGQAVWSIWQNDTPDQRRLGDLRTYFHSRRSAIETKLLQSGDWLLSWAKQILTDFNNKQLKAERDRFSSLTFSHLLAVGGFAWAMYIIVIDVASGLIPVGNMVFMFGVLASMRGSITSLMRTLARQYEEHLLVKDIMEFFNTEPILYRAKNPVKLGLELPPEIIFENVSFRYANQNSGQWTLQNINLTFKPGEKIGLVGNNGTGKSTLTKLLCRVYDPTEGKITVNGIDLREVDINEWWSYLGVMLQDYSNYDFTTKQAIAVGRTDRDLDIDDVKRAAEISQAKGFIEGWKEKYDTPIGVEFDGVEPSKGQRQKLSIAKTVYRDPLIMVLDEPTASVDAESEAKIFDSLESLPKSLTAILISHDFSTISECGAIFVLENGELKEKGNHSTLMSLDGLYAKLYRLQAERFINPPPATAVSLSDPTPTLNKIRPPRPRLSKLKKTEKALIQAV